VIEFGTSKRDRGVAAVTSLLGYKVLRRPHDIGIRQTRTADVAACAIARRTFKNATHMAGFAAGVCMHAFQGKPGFHVVERLVAGLCKHTRTAQQHQRQKQRLPPQQSSQGKPF
jgi:hypothetical protein